jgi:hypothetical protein
MVGLAALLELNDALESRRVPGEPAIIRLDRTRSTALVAIVVAGFLPLAAEESAKRDPIAPVFRSEIGNLAAGERAGHEVEDAVGEIGRDEPGRAAGEAGMGE